MNREWKRSNRMEEEERFLDIVIRQICDELGIKLEKLSYDWVLQLSKDGKIRHITRNHFDNNPYSSCEIANDKYATYEVLKSQNVPVVEHKMVFNPGTRSKYIPEEGIWKEIEKEFSKQNLLVVKPNSGWEGKGVELCHTKKELEIAIQKLFQTEGAISICPYYEIKTEYRTFYLNGEVLLIYGKKKPFIMGNGKSTIQELVKDLHLPDKKIVKDNLKNLEMEKIPDDGEKIEISWKHNLSGGAKPEMLEKGELYQEIKELAIRAGKAVHINFATIDIIQTTQNEFYVLEINAGVCAPIFAEKVEDGYETIKEVYKKAIEDMFL